MSDNYLRLIPTDPQFVPTAESADAARRQLASVVPEADEVTAAVTESVEFIDAGVNFERVSCPKCGRDVDQEWWTEQMDRAAGSQFSTLEITTPCCQTKLSLNDLTYVWPVGFAKFVLQAMNPNVHDLPDESFAGLSRVLGTPLRKIWAHY